MNHETMSEGASVKKAGEVTAVLSRLDENVEVLSNKLSRLFEKISPALADVPEAPKSVGEDRPGASTQVGRVILGTNDKILRLIGEVEDITSKVEL